MGRTHRRILYLAALANILAFAQEGRAVSFDCSNVNTIVEKRICVTQELSRLDDEMAVTYKKALSKAPDPVGLRLYQREWLKIRNSCADVVCIGKEYQKRLDELNRIVSLVPSFNTQESHIFSSESIKLEVIRDVVRWQALRWFMFPYAEAPQFCSQFFEDFLVGNNVEAIEPVFRTDNSNDARFDALNNCKNKPFPEGVGDKSFYYVSMLGGPPYRYYSVDVDGNEANGKEEVIYHEFSGAEGGTGYSWVEVGEEKCEIRGGAGLGMPSWGNTPRSVYRLNTLVLYKGMPLAISVYPTYWTFKPIKYSYLATQLEPSKKPRVCAWSPREGDINTNAKSEK